MVKVEIYEPTHQCGCGGGGSCGCGGANHQAKRLVKAAFSALADVATVDAKRYQIDPTHFAENATVVTAMADDPENLPITLLDGQVVKMGAYPSLDELSDYTGLQFVTADDADQGGCCGGGDCGC